MLLSSFDKLNLLIYTYKYSDECDIGRGSYMKNAGEHLSESYVQDYVMDMLKQMADVSERVGLVELSASMKHLRYEYLKRSDW